jgi:hypothetical protein
LPEQSLSESSPAELATIFYCLIGDSINLEGQVPVFISLRNRLAKLYLRALGSLFVASYDSQVLKPTSIRENDPKEVEVEVEVKLLPTVSRPVLLGVRHPSGTRDQYFFLLEIFFRQLRVCYFEAPSLTRGRVCNLLLLLVLASVVLLVFESRRTQDHILLSQFLRHPQPGGSGPHIYIPQEQGAPDIPSGTGFPFCWLLRLAGLRWSYSIQPPHGAPRGPAYNFLAWITNFFF